MAAPITCGAWAYMVGTSNNSTEVDFMMGVVKEWMEALLERDQSRTYL